MWRCNEILCPMSKYDNEKLILRFVFVFVLFKIDLNKDEILVYSCQRQCVKLNSDLIRAIAITPVIIGINVSL